MDYTQIEEFVRKNYKNMTDMELSIQITLEFGEVLTERRVHNIREKLKLLTKSKGGRPRKRRA
jgi:hypothetical protein